MKPQSRSNKEETLPRYFLSTFPTAHKVMRLRARARTNTHARIHTHTHIYTHTHSLSVSVSLTLTHYTNTRTHTDTHTTHSLPVTHTYTHTHTLVEYATGEDVIPVVFRLCSSLPWMCLSSPTIQTCIVAPSLVVRTRDVKWAILMNCLRVARWLICEPFSWACASVRVARGQLTLQWAHRSLVRGTLIPLFLYSVFLSFVHRLVMSVIFFFL